MNAGKLKEVLGIRTDGASLSSLSLNEKIVQIIYILFTAGFVVLFGSVVLGIGRPPEWAPTANDKTLLIGTIFIALIALTILLFVTMEDRPLYVIAIGIFLLALTLRLIAVAATHIDPISDFWNYWNWGILVSKGHFAEVYPYEGLPWMGGLALLNGIIAQVFGTSVQSFQVVHSIMTSLICVAIFLLGSQYKKTVGIIAGLLFAIYPGNIFASLILTNEHGAVLFFLLGVFFATCAYRANKRRVLFITLSILTFLASHYFKGTTVSLLILAIIIVAILGVLRYMSKPKTARKIALHFVIIIVVGMIGFSSIITNLALPALGVVKSTVGKSIFATMLIGTNEQSTGGWNYDDVAFTVVHSDDEIREEVIGRLAHMDNIAEFFAKKLWGVYGSPDDHIGTYSVVGFQQWYEETHGLSESATPGDLADLDEAFVESYWEFVANAQAAAILDVYFVTVLLLLSIIGVIVRSRKGGMNVMDLYLVTAVGFALAFCLCEIQPRYRYMTMPLIFTFAAVAIEWLAVRTQTWKRHIFDKSTIRKSDDEVGDTCYSK